MRRMVLFVAMAALLAANGCGDKPAPTVTTFSVTVDYSRSLAEMVAAGNYDYIDPDITEANFPISGNGKVEIELELVHFNRMINSNDVFIELHRLGLRPATLAELLAFGAAYPAEQIKYPIIAFGSVATVATVTGRWRSHDRSVPYLCDNSVMRGLGLNWFEGGWLGYVRFLAVRKSR